MLQELIAEIRVVLSPQWLCYAALLGFIFWRAWKTWLIYQNRPRNLFLGGSTLRVGKWLSSFRYVASAPDIISRAYSKSNGRPIAIPSLSEYQVLISSKEDIEQLDDADEEQLSFHAAMVDRLQHKHTMYGFEHNDVDPHNAIPVRTLKVLLRMNIADLQPSLQPKIEKAFQHELGVGRSIDGWRSVSVLRLARRVISQMNNHVLFGAELANNDEYIEAAIQYNEDVVIAMELCRQIPSFLVGLVAPAVMAWSGAMKRVAGFLEELIESRVQEAAHFSKKSNIYMDCVEWIMNCSHTEKQRSVSRLVQQMVALLFASAHQMPMALSYAIFSLCQYPEYIEGMRKEVEAAMSRPLPYENMPLLDAFLRESARLNPLDALGMQRKVLQPYTFGDGSFIPKGNLVCVPQQALMRDSNNYPDPTKFDPTRYLVLDDDQTLRAMPRFTDVKMAFPYWGAPKRACPARWYVSAALKQVLAHLIMNYDFRFEKEKAPRMFSWTTALVPRPSVNILLRERQIQKKSDGT